MMALKLKEIMDKPHGVISIIGMRGTGKTYLTKRLLNYVDVDKIIIFDVVGVYDDLEGIRLEFDKVILKYKLFDVMDKLIKSDEKIITVDLSLLSRKEMREVINDISEYLIIRKPKTISVMVVADEVGEYMEQERGIYAERFESLVRIGRNKNILWVIMTTQRAQKVNKHILALSDLYIIFRVMHNLDLEAVKNIMGMDTKSFKQYVDYIKQQQTGYFILYDGIDVYKFNNNQEGKNWKEKEYKLKRYNKEIKEQAIDLYKKGKTIKAISELLNIKYETVKNWIRIYKRNKKGGN